MSLNEEKALHTNMAESKTSTVTREFIKPSIQTPTSLKTFKMSLLDQITPDLHANMSFFYLPSRFKSSDSNASHAVADFSAKSQHLKDSISRTLTRFYPFAGRFLDDSTVDCNDEGVLFIEAQSDISLNHFLLHPDLHAVVDNHILPSANLEVSEVSHGSQLVFKFISFQCGGCALGVTISHKIGDLLSLATFLRSLSLECRGVTNPLLPDFTTGPSLLPAREIPSVKTSAIISSKKFVTRRLVFHASKIRELKAQILSALKKEGKEFQPSRVEVVEALIGKSVMAAYKSRTCAFRPLTLVQAVNIRTRKSPPLPDNAIGNLMWMFAVTVEEESQMDIVELVKMLREMKDSLNDKATKFNSEDIAGIVQQSQKDRENHMNNSETMIFSSFFNYPLSEIDLGWGNPEWVTSKGRNLMTNTCYLLDNIKEEGGVEAVVHLSEEVMNLFACDRELLPYSAITGSELRSLSAL